MENIKAIIFDLDDTLANTLPLCIKAFKESIQPLINREISDAEIIATFGPSEEGTIMALAPDQYQQGVADYLGYYESFHEMCPVPFAGIKELLIILKQKGVYMAMVTGKGRHSTDISLKYLGLEGYFSMIETGSPEGPRKAAGIKAVLDTLPGIKKREVLYVGDAPSDITASREAGIPVAAAAWAETAEPEVLNTCEPDAMFFSVADFSSWLFKRLEIN
jgi:phosphoglycolate phosphatase-like HAD superfamily hydrolase